MLDFDKIQDSLFIFICVAQQNMTIYHKGKIQHRYTISTGLKGVGEKKGSEQTPRGWHYIRAKIGKNAAINTIFVGRRPTGEFYSEALQRAYPNRDWILTRILWLSGLELRKNRLGEVDTMQRYIYIHGTADHAPMGIPLSHGCIRMRNQDVMELFDLVPVGTPICINIDPFHPGVFKIS